MGGLKIQRRPELKVGHVGFGKSPPQCSPQNDFASSGSLGLCLIFSHSAITTQEWPGKSMGNPGKQSAQKSTGKQKETRSGKKKCHNCFYLFLRPLLQCFLCY